MKQNLLAMLCVCVVASASVAGASARSQYAKPDPAKPDAAKTAPKSEPSERFVSDRYFVAEAAHSATADAELGRLALEKSRDAAVRDYAKRLVATGGKLREDLAPLLEAHGLTVSTEIDNRHKVTRDWLLRAPAAAFDRAFMTAMNAKAINDVTFVERAPSIVKDPAVKAWAIRTLPIVKAQYEAAKEIVMKLR